MTKNIDLTFFFILKIDLTNMIHETKVILVTQLIT